MRNSYLVALLLTAVLSACQTKGSNDAALTPTGYAVFEKKGRRAGEEGE